MDMSAPEGIDELGVQVRRAVGRLYRRLRFERSDDTLGDTPSSVLATLARRGAHSLRELSEREHVTPPAMNQTMNSLVASGYVVREPDPTDGRKVFFVATADGIAMAAQTRHRRHSWLNNQLAQLSPAERNTLQEAAQILRRIADA
jgi:DNA-binding MarR family transcriptional regulator